LRSSLITHTGSHEPGSRARKHEVSNNIGGTTMGSLKQQLLGAQDKLEVLHEEYMAAVAMGDDLEADRLEMEMAELEAEIGLYLHNLEWATHRHEFL
jgi:hypothetical protein